MSAAIVKNRIAGTRITVFDVYYYLVNGESHASICESLRLTPEQLQSALDYIAENKSHVETVHQQIEERNARGNPPEIEALRVGSRERMQKWLEEQRAKRTQEENCEGPPRRC